MKKTHIVLYVTSITWNLTVCWPVVLLIRVLWGESLRFERNRDKKVHDGWSLWCDLKKGSWPTRSWYARYKSRSWFAWLTKEKPIPGATWGGTTLGHGGFYGFGIADPDGWTQVQDHEHHHVEQFEASMLRSFFVGLSLVVVLLIAGHTTLALVVGLLCWWSGYLLMGIASWSTAALRGESPYLGSHHEEAAYKLDDDWRDGLPVEKGD